MNHTRIAAVTNGCAGACVDLSNVVEAILEGARGAGCEAEHFSIFRDPADVTSPSIVTARKIAGPAQVDELVADLPSYDHLILGFAGNERLRDGAFGLFLDSCYKHAKWLTLGDVVDMSRLNASLGNNVDPGIVAFPVAGRELSETHRGLVVLEPPAEVPDHDDPFLENTFFLLEEAERLLGFLPSGRILSTGLFYPPLDQNPMLKQQAFEMGRRLVSGVAVTRDGKE